MTMRMPFLPLDPPPKPQSSTPARAGQGCRAPGHLAVAALSGQRYLCATDHGRIGVPMMASRRRLLGLAVPAWADDAGLVARLATLSAAKGSGREFFPEICAALRLPAAICGKTASC